MLKERVEKKGGKLLKNTFNIFNINFNYFANFFIIYDLLAKTMTKNFEFSQTIANT